MSRHTPSEEIFPESGLDEPITVEPEPESGPPTPQEDAAVRNYIFIGLAALVAVFLVLARRGLGSWSLLPVLVGLLGLTLRWRASSVLFLLVLCGLIYYQETMERVQVRPFDRRGFRTFHLPDWLLSGAVLAYCAAHARLLGLTVFIFPPDRRRREEPASQPTGRPRWFSRSPKQRRPSRLVNPWEVSWLVLSLPVWAFLAQVCWKLLPTHLDAYNLEPATWQGIILVWMLAVGLFLAAGFLSYAGQQQVTRREALLFFQDAVWQETRREQRRIGSWLAWARLRRRREKS
jgi:hypothetical protein